MSDVQSGRDPSSSNAASQPGLEARMTDLARIGVVALFAYISFTLIAPFAIIILWATILTVALYPAYLSIYARLGGRARLAAAILTLACLVVIVSPIGALSLSFVDAVHLALAKLNAGAVTIPAPPETVKDWPLVGKRVYGAWGEASGNFEATFQRLEPSLLMVGTKILAGLASLGTELLSFFVSVIIMGFFLVSATRLSGGAQAFAQKMGGNRGRSFAGLAAATIRNVARGIIGVALVQAFWCALIIGLFGVPAPGAIGFAVLIFCIVQIGPLPVVLPVMIWAWAQMDAGSALAMTLLLAPVFVVDNVMKPMLVARGLSTPMIVILIGVLGGTLAYGLVGLFLGPIVLSVFYDLLKVWMRTGIMEPDLQAEP